MWKSKYWYTKILKVLRKKEKYLNYFFTTASIQYADI